jgi:hypothetical protein
MFHLAIPPVNGFTVTTCTPGLVRSFQPLTFFGLPLRRPKTTTEFQTTPLWLCLSQFGLIRPLSTRSLMSLPVLRITPSAGRPFATA